MRRETHESIERLERRLVEGNGQGPLHNPNGQRYDAFVDGVETSVTESMHEPPRVKFQRGSRVENDRVVVEKWIWNADQCTKTHSLREDLKM